MSSWQGKRVLVTGATDGIGLLTAKRLAAAGARVWVHGRQAARLERALKEVPGAGAYRADFSSLHEVRTLAETLLREPPLDLLIHNAALGAGARGAAREVSADGFELRWAVNLLAPFALTEWLLAEGVAPRAVVNVASLGQAPLDFADLQLERRYDGFQAYMRSKLAMIVWTTELAARRPDLLINSLHPGTFLATKMVAESGIEPMGTVDSGAVAVVGVSETTLAGRERGEFFDVQRKSRALDQAYDVKAQQRLRQAALDMLRAAGVPAPGA
ncbi:3-oxoacyl-ACP reductase [Corallococcus sp. H22C18031201]|nr:3-oxoacyl-ACP reductase [Corallococcus sp. H22C18031201]